MLEALSHNAYVRKLTLTLNEVKLAHLGKLGSFENKQIIHLDLTFNTEEQILDLLIPNICNF